MGDSVRHDQHDQHDQHDHEAHEHGGGLAHYLEKAREGIEKRGEKANQLAEKALEENSIAGAGAPTPHGMGR